MLYRTRSSHPDGEFGALVDRLLDEHDGDAIELVFNGDLLDFDAPWVKDGVASFDEFPLTDEGCGAQAERIAADHSKFFEAVARVAERGHRVVFLSGNHDLELCFPRVRSAISRAIAAHTTAPIDLV